MSLLVKVCGLSEQQHVNTAIDAGAGAVGFVFAESVRRITPKRAFAICTEVPEYVKRVAVMLHPGSEEWQDVLRNFGPDILQADAEDFKSLEVPGTVECWPVYREGCTRPDTDGVYVYEGPKSGRGEVVDWSNAAKLAARGRLILAGGLAEDNVALAVSIARPYGVDVSSGVEIAPGQKDSELIRKFVIAAMAAGKEG